MTEPNRPRSIYAYLGRLAIIDPPRGGDVSRVRGGLSETPRLVSREEKDV